MKKISDAGVGGRMLEMVNSIYKETWSAVISEEGVSEDFRTRKGVGRGCSQSPLLFDIAIDDIDEEIKRREIGGVTLSGKKILVLKFADDIVLVAKSAKELQEMLNLCHSYLTRNKLEMNTKKTKVMVCRKGGRLKNSEKWSVNGQMLEVVNDYKYLGYWFNTSNTASKHLKEMEAKTRKAVGATWGLTKRAKVGSLKKRRQLYEAIAKSGGLYGIEIWGWARRTQMEVMQGRLVKSALGVRRNTPDYIWKLEAGRRSSEVEARNRASRYLGEILGKNDERWPWAALREEVRAILNNKPTRWGKELEEAFKQSGDGITLQMIWEKADIETIKTRLERNVETLKNQDIQRDWNKVDSSSYNPNYRALNNTTEAERYWEDKKWTGGDKEQWARLKCGNLTIDGNMGYKGKRCRVCKGEEENMGHMGRRASIQEKGKKEIIDKWYAWREKLGGWTWKRQY